MKKDHQIHLRISGQEYEELKKIAEHYPKGTVSELLRSEIKFLIFCENDTIKKTKKMLSEITPEKQKDHITKLYDFLKFQLPIHRDRAEKAFQFLHDFHKKIKQVFEKKYKTKIK